MKKITFFLLLLSVLVTTGVSISGCEKYLDTKSDAKLVVPHTLADLQGILDDATSMNLMRTPAYGESCSDDMFLLPTTVATLGVNLTDVYLWKRIDYTFGNDWSDAYLPIYNANLCLEILNTIPRTTQNAAQWDNIKGSALFYRSYYIYLLTTQYGLAYNKNTSGQDLGVIIRLSSDFNIKGQRSSVQACMERVIADAADAIELLPVYGNNLLRPSRIGTMAHLSRVNLYMGNYELAAKFADQCIALKPSLMDFKNDTDVLGLDLAVTFRQFNKETLFYSEMAYGFDLHSTSIAKIDTTLYVSYNSNDLRKRAYFRASGLYRQFKGSYSSSGSVFFTGLATDEMYLNRAEGRAFAGDTDGAMADLNLLLKSRWASIALFSPLTATSKEEALRKIREERRKELLMRNLRWADLKRYNAEGAGIELKRIVNGQIYSLKPNSPFYALPIPSDIIEQAGIPQN